MRKPLLALLDISLLTPCAFLLTSKAYQVDPRTAYFLAPYCAWLSYATYLNGAFLLRAIFSPFPTVSPETRRSRVPATPLVNSGADTAPRLFGSQLGSRGSTTWVRGSRSAARRIFDRNTRPPPAACHELWMDREKHQGGAASRAGLHGIGEPDSGRHNDRGRQVSTP